MAIIAVCEMQYVQKGRLVSALDVHIADRENLKALIESEKNSKLVRGTIEEFDFRGASAQALEAYFQRMTESIRIVSSSAIIPKAGGNIGATYNFGVSQRPVITGKIRDLWQWYLHNPL